MFVVMGDERKPLLNYPNNINSIAEHELHSFLHSVGTLLKWLCVDQSSAWTICLSWFVFLVFAILVPALSYFVFGRHSSPYDTVAQLSLSTFATLSFVCLSNMLRSYGLQSFLLLDKVHHVTPTKGYTKQLNRSVKVLFGSVMSCFAVESAYNIWWYSSGGGRKIPFLGNVVVSNTVACMLDLCSWFYRTMVFFLVCVLFRLLCHLQILRLKDFTRVFRLVGSDVESILKGYLIIKIHLRIISHRYRAFITYVQLSILAGQFASLLMVIRPNADVNLYYSGELAICSISLLVGFSILLGSAAKIAQKGQAVAYFAARWHVCETIESSPTMKSDIPFASKSSNDQNSCGGEEDQLDHSRFIQSYAYNAISYQKRQSLVTYFEKNGLAISVYGVVLDRTQLRFTTWIEFLLVLCFIFKMIG